MFTGIRLASRQSSTDAGELFGHPASWCPPFHTSARCKLVGDRSPSGDRSFADDFGPSCLPHHPHGTPHHHTSRTSALSSTHPRYLLGDVSGALTRNVRESWAWPVISVAAFPHPPPPHPPPNAGCQHAFPHLHTLRAFLCGFRAPTGADCGYQCEPPTKFVFLAPGLPFAPFGVRSSSKPGVTLGPFSRLAPCSAHV